MKLKYAKKSDIYSKNVILLYKSGMSALNIVKNLNCSIYLVKSVLNAAGFDTKRKNRWKNYELISGNRWSRIVANAKSRNIKFEISIEDAWSQWIKQNGFCIYTNTLLTHPQNTNQLISGKFTASLDRINNDGIYSKDNIQWIDKNINFMKSNFSEIRFIELCNLVVNKINFNNLLIDKIPSFYFSQIKNSAKRRNLDFNITNSNLTNLFNIQYGNCALSGQNIYFDDEKHKFTTASLDRIKSNIHYNISNVQWVHKDINRMKFNLDQNEFIHLCHKIINFKTKVIYESK